MAGTCKRCKGTTTDTRERGIGVCFNCEHGLECQPKQNEEELEMGMGITFNVKGIELYSEKEAKIILHGKRGSMISIYVPVEDVHRYWLNQRFILAEG